MRKLTQPRYGRCPRCHRTLVLTHRAVDGCICLDCYTHAVQVGRLLRREGRLRPRHTDS